MQDNNFKLPLEEQISQMVDNAASRIEQYQAALKKEYNRGPELRLDPPDKWNSPDGPFARIEQLNRSIESVKMNTLKRTYEIAENLPKDRQQAAINLAFDKLAPEIKAKEYQQEKEGLTDKFSKVASEITDSGKVPFYSRFFDPQRAGQQKENLEKTMEIEDGQKAAERMPFKSRFMAQEQQQQQPFVSRFIGAATPKIENEKTQQKEYKPDFSPEK